MPLMLMLKGGDQIQGKVPAEAFKAVVMRIEEGNTESTGSKWGNKLQCFAFIHFTKTCGLPWRA